MTVTIPLWLIVVVVEVVLALTTYLVGYWHGYGAGIRDTEQRWSDAVRRKECAEFGAPNIDEPARQV